MQLLLPSYRYYLMLRRLSLVLGLLLIVLIFALADSPLATGAIHYHPPLDKLLHAGVYGTIAALLRFAGTGRHAVLLWLLVVGVGLLDELNQLSIVGRQFGMVDLLANAVGVTLGIYLMGMLSKRIFVKADSQAYHAYK